MNYFLMEESNQIKSNQIISHEMKETKEVLQISRLYSLGAILQLQ